MNTARTFIFFGPSGGGKGTQAALLEDYLKKNDTSHKVLSLSTGNLFREFVKSDTYTAGKVKDILDDGGLLPEFLPIWIWTNFLNKNVKDNTEHFIFDGMARREDEAPVLDGALEFYNRFPADVLIMDVSPEWATKRLKERGRYDDNDEDIKARLEWYETNVVPSINYFREKKEYRIYDIDGEKSLDEVHKDILEKLKL